jgi:putative CocE/NonD family hydrolase
VVIQDTRGRWASDGDGYPLVNEMADGYDTVIWCAQQPWSNGKVGMFGGSYVGYTQLAAAVTHPPPLRTIIPAVTFCDPRSIFFQGGALALGSGVSWGLLALAQMAIMRHQGGPQEKADLMSQLIAAVDGMAHMQTFHKLPLLDIPLIGRSGIVPFLADIVAHSSDDEFWQRVNCPHEEINLPAYHIGGWYDLFIGNTLSDYNAIRQKGNPHQKLLVGPWVHAKYEGLNGEVDFGLQASAMILLPDEMQLRWFDYWLKGVDTGILSEPPIQIFVMGDNAWRTEEVWPLTSTKYTPYYLHSHGSANTLNGNGWLSLERPSDEAVDSYIYDPHNPVPTRGGGLCCWDAALPAGAYDQGEIEKRPDVLVYTTQPLEHDVEVTGPLMAYLWAASTAPDTDFTAKLVDVGPCSLDGCNEYARNVADGLLRTRCRNSGQVSLIKPGEVYEFTIDIGVTSNVFKAGHRIRLEISSSNFPRFDRNPNTGGPVAEEINLRPALQTIYHDNEHLSYILLPIIPRS